MSAVAKVTMIYRSCHPTVFYKKRVLEILQISQENICASLFLNKVEGLRLATLLKKRPWRRFFPVNLAKILRTPFFIELLQ